MIVEQALVAANSSSPIEMIAIPVNLDDQCSLMMVLMILSFRDLSSHSNCHDVRLNQRLGFVSLELEVGVLAEESYQ